MFRMEAGRHMHFEVKIIHFAVQNGLKSLVNRETVKCKDMQNLACFCIVIGYIFVKISLTEVEQPNCSLCVRHWSS